jgi:hypothetical protein
VTNMAKLLWLTAGVVILGAVGCGETPSETGSSGSGSGPLCPDDPAEGPVADECGIWLSRGGIGDSHNDGTQASPVDSWERATKLAQEGPGRIYACGGQTWFEPIVVPAGVSVYGGFNCNNNWSYEGAANLTRVIAAPGEIGMTWLDSGSAGQLVLADFYVESKSAVVPGGSSIAVLIRDTKKFFAFYHCEIIAGDGADGLDGAPGGAGDLPATEGTAGNPGADACSAPLSKGGAAPETVCSVGTSNGGAGGDGSPIIAANGGAGEPAGGLPGGEGGLGEQTAPVCTAGADGASGTDGAFGHGGQARGRLTVDGYVGHAGEDGEPGTAAQGGGGGGARFGKAAVCGAANPGGAAGGSGGAGGCGGKAGKGGQAGGSSIGVAGLGKVSFLRNGHIKTGRGGDGGNGGPPEGGGDGGLPGQGGAGSGSIKPGCPGGAGGNGGKGGWGGGGLGGTSAPIAVVRSADGGADLTATLEFGPEGKGGIGEEWAIDEARGKDGTAAINLELDP